MKIISQSKKGIITNAIKTHNELAEDELASLRFAFGEGTADYADYQVRRNGKNELLGVKPYTHSAAKSAAIEEATAQPDIMDAMQVVYGRGRAKAQAVKKYADAGFTENEVKEAVLPHRDDTLIDGYLARHGLTRYAVAQKTGTSQTTLANAAARDTAKGLSAKVISTIAMAIGTDAGKVLNDLIYLEAERDVR